MNAQYKMQNERLAQPASVSAGRFAFIIHRSAFIISGALTAAVLAAGSAGAAQAPEFPTKPVRFIVPFTPGAINDMLARLIGACLGESWSQQVVVDNRAGAGTVIGTDMVAKSPPDGYTLLLVSTAFAINQTLYPKLPYDTVKDFSPVTQIASAPFLLVVYPQLPVKSVKELVALAKGKPGQLSYGSTGSGGTAHLIGEMFKATAGVDIVHIPYKGLAPAMTDVIAGQVSMTLGSYSTLGPQLKAGRLKALAVTSKSRFRVAPDVPTIAEAGYPNFDATAWWGVAVPAGTPQNVIAKLHADIIRCLQKPEVRDRLSTEGADVATSTPAQFAEFLKQEVVKWGKVVKMSGAKVD
jgi:tripartite-type tricarboxylate transporter receptor subunit TctC